MIRAIPASHLLISREGGHEASRESRETTGLWETTKHCCGQEGDLRNLTKKRSWRVGFDIAIKNQQ